MFETARALSLHLARSPACEQFANERDQKRNARKLSLLNVEIVVQSSKRPTLFCRDVVNDITQIVQQESENEVLKDWSDFNFPDMYDNKMDAYEQMIPPQQVNTTMTQFLRLPKKTIFRYCRRTRTNVILSPSKRPSPYVHI